MALLKREEWQAIVRDVDWTPTYVDDDALYPEWMSGGGKVVPREAWKRWEESYKVSYPEYVATQREKESSAYAVQAALKRSNAFETLDEGWKSSTKMHFGGVALLEGMATFGQLKMARFAPSPAWRNMAVFGALDELRHTQIALMFAHEFVSKDPQYDWAQKAINTESWLAVAMRNLFDAIIPGPNTVDVAIKGCLVVETGFTNLQFVGLSAAALEAGDVNFSNMASSVQTDEARHAQQGGPTLEILVEHDPARAQWNVDRSFWLYARAFAGITGVPMDYYTPVENRKQSYREYMEEWIIDQFMRTLADYGLRRPWYWDEFMEGLDTWTHSMNLGLWLYRPTLWWNPAAGVDEASRVWLNEKYPNWETIYGDKWRVIAENINAGNLEATLPETLPWFCSMCQLPAFTPTYGRDGRWRVRNYSLKYNGMSYHFCTKTCRQIWWEDRDNLNHTTIVDRFLQGEIQPMDMSGVISYMGLTPEVMGVDAHNYAWAKSFAAPAAAPTGGK